MTSGYLMYISTYILGCSNTTFTSHISSIHTSYSWYKLSPIKILVVVSDATVENDSLESTTGNCMYPLTTFLDFRQTNPSASFLLLNTQLTGTEFLTLAFTTILFIVIHAYLDRILFTSEIVDIFHKCPFGLVIASLRVSGSPASIEIDVLHAHWILSSLCSTIVMTMVSPVYL